MMKTIVEEKLVSFKTLEQKIYKYICTCYHSQSK